MTVIVPPVWRGGDTMFLDLVISVMAGVIVYYICKWLDRHL